MKRHFVAFAIVLSPMFLFSQKVNELDSLAKSAILDTVISDQALMKMYNNPKTSIPILIRYLTINDSTFVGSIDVYSSEILPGHLSYAGVKAATMIEWILSSDPKFSNLCGKQKNGFRQCIIVRSNDRYSRLNFGDMEKLQTIYQHQWDKIQRVDLNKYRKEFVPFNAILKGSSYQWL